MAAFGKSFSQVFARKAWVSGLRFHVPSPLPLKGTTFAQNSDVQSPVGGRQSADLVYSSSGQP